MALLAVAIEEPVDRTGPAHLFEAFPQCPSPAVKPHRDVVERCAQGRRQSVSWFTEYVGAPDYVGVLGLQRRQQPIEAVADCSVEFEIGVDGLVLEADPVDVDFPAAPANCASLVVDDRRRKNPAQPPAHRPHVPDLCRALKCANRESLQNLLRLITITQTHLKELEQFLLYLDERPLNRRVMRLGGIALVSVGHLMALIVGVRHLSIGSAFVRDAH